MKLPECKRCDLCNNRGHISFSKGQKPASVMIVFGREPSTERDNKRLDEFLRILNYELKRDFYFSFAIKCFTKEKVSLQNLQKCNFWLQKEISKVNPYLLIMVGKLATIAVMNKEMEKNIQPNVFYKSDSENVKYYFRSEPIMGNIDKLDFSLNKVVLFLKEFYGC